ncbi:MAG: rhodanese [Candidatus Thiodiazotropha sp. (ex Lucinoma kastoroae)]|nr:rhodanese [Candidatus Thiodiazotropha sp. (ex Lucinoma kastoroae)]
MKVYLVGGAVRDQLLDLPVVERDWVVVGATPEEMLAADFRRADSDFPVFLHPETGEEYALARTEVKTGAGYKGFQVESDPEISLEQDLLRRDLTINAMAMDERGNLIDICGGREDLDNGLLRHITTAFTEDPVRLLRMARFAAKLGRWGFRVAHETHALMKKMAASADLMSLKPERIWREMNRSFSEPQPWRFFEVLHNCGALRRLLPDVAAEMGIAGHEKSNQAQVMAPLKQVVEASDDPVVRCGVALFAVVLMDSNQEEWMDKLRLDKAGRLLLSDLLDFNQQIDEMYQAECLLRFAIKLKPQQQPKRFQRFLIAANGLWPQALSVLLPVLKMAAEIVEEKVPESLMGSELKGPALGKALFAWRVNRLQEVIRNMGAPN